MNRNIFKPGMRLNAAVAGVVLEGIVSGCNFLVLFKVLEMIFGNTINYKDIVQATIFLGIIFVIRLHPGKQPGAMSSSSSFWELYQGPR